MADTRARTAQSSEAPFDARFEAWPCFLEAHAVLTRRMDAVLRERTGIPLAWYDVAAHLHGAPGRRLPIGELERVVFLSQSGVSRLVARMEEAGLVRRDRPATDRRTVEVTLTRQGAAAYRRAFAVQSEQVRTLFADHLSLPQARTLRSLLRRVTAAAE